MSVSLSRARSPATHPSFPSSLHSCRVERSHGNKRREERGRGAYAGQHSNFRVLVTGLPASCSWQDLKDFCRDAGTVLFTDVARDGSGVVEFEKEDDMLWALKNFDGKRLKTHTVSVGM